MLFKNLTCILLNFFLFTAALPAAFEDYKFYPSSKQHFENFNEDDRFVFKKKLHHADNNIILIVATANSTPTTYYHVHLTNDGRIRFIHAEGHINRSRRHRTLGVPESTESIESMDAISLIEEAGENLSPSARHFLIALQRVINRFMPEAAREIPELGLRENHSLVNQPSASSSSSSESESSKRKEKEKENKPPEKKMKVDENGENSKPATFIPIQQVDTEQENQPQRMLGSNLNLTIRTNRPLKRCSEFDEMFD